MSIIAFSRTIGPIPLDCILTEQHSSEVEITGNPIESGAEVNDHAYIKPKQVTLDVADSNAALVYNALVRFQEARIPFYLVTGLTVYKDMLIQAIDATRDKSMSRVLRATVICRQVIIVGTASVPAEGGGASSAQTGNPGGTNSQRSATPTAERASSQATADRVAQPVQTGDNPTTEVNQPRSILSRIF